MRESGAGNEGQPSEEGQSLEEGQPLEEGQTVEEGQSLEEGQPLDKGPSDSHITKPQPAYRAHHRSSASEDELLGSFFS
jgi:hypothetical protein